MCEVNMTYNMGQKSDTISIDFIFTIMLLLPFSVFHPNYRANMRSNQAGNKFIIPPTLGNSLRELKQNSPMSKSPCPCKNRSNTVCTCFLTLLMQPKMSGYCAMGCFSF